MPRQAGSCRLSQTLGVAKTRVIVTEEESLLAAINADVALEDYDCSWPTKFAAEEHRLLCLFPSLLVGIEHIGSTAVPGLKAKPIIDLLAGVETMAVAESLAEPLQRSGYTTSAKFNATLFDRKWFMRWSNGLRTHHLHVVVHNSRAWYQRIKFRDALRANDILAKRYVTLKIELAAKHHTDREAYTNAKADFVRSVVGDA